MKIEQVEDYYVINNVMGNLSVSFDTKDEAELFLKFAKARCKIEILSNGHKVVHPPERLSDLKTDESLN